MVHSRRTAQWTKYASKCCQRRHCRVSCCKFLGPLVFVSLKFEIRVKLTVSSCMAKRRLVAHLQRSSSYADRDCPWLELIFAARRQPCRRSSASAISLLRVCASESDSNCLLNASHGRSTPLRLSWRKSSKISRIDAKFRMAAPLISSEYLPRMIVV